MGSAICKAAISQGIDVVSLSRFKFSLDDFKGFSIAFMWFDASLKDLIFRSGRPSYSDSWVDQVVWVAGNGFPQKNNQPYF